MSVNFKELQKMLRQTDIGRKLTLYNSRKDIEVSNKQMVWLDAAVLYCDLSGYTSLTTVTRNETVASIKK